MLDGFLFIVLPRQLNDENRKRHNFYNLGGVIFRLTFLIGSIFFAAASCNRNPDSKPDSKPVAADTAQRANRIETPAAPPLRVAYRLYPLNDSLLKALPQTFDSARLATLLALNRIDLRKVRAKDTLAVPDTFVADFNAYAPFPRRLALADSVRKLLVCSYPLQAFAAYEHGSLVRWGPSSLGKKSTPTPTGLFHTNWKAKRTVSTENPEWILDWYFNLTNFTGVSLHEYELPGYPASHACVRLKAHDARWIYCWAEQWKLSPDGSYVLTRGTPVVIYGTYDFEKRRPWLKLAESSDAFAIDEPRLTDVLQPYLPTVLQRQAHRHSVINALADTLPLASAQPE